MRVGASPQLVIHNEVAPVRCDRTNFAFRPLVCGPDDVVHFKRQEAHHAGHGQFGQPHPWRSGKVCLERAFQLHLPPATVSVQPVRSLECCALRHGNVHSADGWQEVLQDEFARRDPIAIVQITSALWEPIYEWKISIGVAEVDETGCRQRQKFSGELFHGHDPSRCIAPGSHSNQ